MLVYSPVHVFSVMGRGFYMLNNNNNIKCDHTLIHASPVFRF